MIMLKYMVFLMPVLHFNSVSVLFEMGCLKYKTDRKHELTPTQINVDNYWKPCDVLIFP